jgi:hypothetical protein
MEDRIAQVAGIVDDDVDAPVGGHGRLDEAGRGAMAGDVAAVGQCAAASGLDLAHHRCRGRLLGRCARQRRQIWPRRGTGASSGDATPDASARARDHGDLAGQQRGGIGIQHDGTSPTVQRDIQAEAAAKNAADSASSASMPSGGA